MNEASKGARSENGVRAHRSRQLFSNHFLEERLRGSDLWEEMADEAAEVRDRLRDIYEDQRPALEGANERQTEDRWIQPVLEVLGWGWEVQPASERHGTVQFPDYALFLSQEEADRAAGTGERKKVLQQGSSVLEAKRWDRDLDAGDPASDDLNRVPSTQIINYLVRAGQRWGILTNGDEWRLYYRDADFADTSYFAVDLAALLGDEPLTIGEKSETIPAEEAFRYFYLFFRAEAFRVEAEEKCWLDLAYERSTRYARAVEEALKPRAYRAVSALCRGFAAAHDISPTEIESDPDLAGTLLDNSLTLLFRLLFLLYAESRDLLPVRSNPAYRRKSLLELRERAADQRDAGESMIPRGRDYWGDLHDLFRIVDGDPAWRAVGIPVYNGGLFDPEKHPWLEEHYVADPQLAEAIDLLSRTQDPETGEQHFVDYAPLDVRNLGSIYEGLLEHRLRVADEELPEVREQGRTVRDPVEEGELYLADDRGERKVTGSFYTPDYVVEYIIEETLGPLTEGRAPAEILELSLLDPAMGSGHFLVSATSYLARAAVRSVEEADQQVLGEFAELDPEQLRRLVVERCIFGVDKNPRAVELAKLSLWIATVQHGKPLNFLDHHLKCGDSLLGGRVADLGGLPGRSSQQAAQEAAGQINAFETAFARRLDRVVGLIHDIERMLSDDLDSVQHKEQLYREADEMLDRFRAVANLWCAAPFGVELDGDDYARAVQALEAPPSVWEELTEEDWFREARALAEEHGFFHWDVEFSEVFYEEDATRRERPGFDAVVGNPPYVRMEEFKELKDYLRTTYESYATRTDLYVFFMERSVDLLREGGEYGVIVSNKFLRANYGKGIRRLMSEQTGIRNVVDFGGLGVFPDATVRAAVLLSRAGSERRLETRYTAIENLGFVDRGEDLSDQVEGLGSEVASEDIAGEDWRLVPREVSAVVKALVSCGEQLRDVVEGPIGWGVKTGRNDAFIIDGDTRRRLIQKDSSSREVIKPLLRGNDIRRYHVRREDKWLLYLPHSIDIARYPAVREHLELYRDSLEARSTEQAWYELQQPQEAYTEFFEEPKLVFPDMAREPRFSLDRSGSYPANTVYFIPVSDASWPALLNSSVAHFYFQVSCAMLEGKDDAYLRFMGQYLEPFPVWRPAQGESPTHSLHEWLVTVYHRGFGAKKDRQKNSSRHSLEQIRTKVNEELPTVELLEMAAVDASRPVAFLEEQVERALASNAPGEATIQEFLGFLSETMSELHEERLREIDRFLDWLETRLGCPIDDLSGKTYVRAYWEQPEGVDKLLETIEKNRPSTTDLDVREPDDYGAENPERGRIVDGFEKSMETLDPILEQLELTDELIDRIVYRLYGLTDEEVAVIKEYVQK